MENLWMDLRRAWRALRRSPGTSLTTVLLLALGIGGVAGLFSPLYSLVLAPLPFPHSEQLVRIGGDIPLFNTYSNTFEERGRLAPIFSAVTGHVPFLTLPVQLSIGGPRKPVKIHAVTSEFMETLGVQPQLGHSFAQEKSNASVIILSDHFWHKELEGARDVIGRSIQLGDRPYFVIGVMPKGFEFPEMTDVWMPMGENAFDKNEIQFVGRLRLGLSLSQGATQLKAIGYKRGMADGRIGSDGPVLESLQTAVHGERRPLIWILWAVSILFLLLACAGAANLLLAQGVSRRPEMVVRLVLGAGRWRLVRQLLTETLLLASAGGLLGIWLSTIAGRWLQRQLPEMQGAKEFVPATMVLVAALVAAVTIVCGLAPALHATRANLSASLKSGFSGATVSKVGRRFFTSHEYLAGVQLTLALVLLVNSGLLVRSLISKLDAPLGFDPRDVAKIEFALPRLPELTTAYRSFTQKLNLDPHHGLVGRVGEDMNRALASAQKSEATRNLSFNLEAQRQLAGLPEIVSVGALAPPPFSAMFTNLEALGVYRVYPQVYKNHPDPASGIFPPSVEAEQRYVGAHTFGILGVRILAGRDFTPEEDVANAITSQKASPEEPSKIFRVTIISNSLAQQFWPNGGALGQHIYTPDARTVVGIVSDFRENFDPQIRPVFYLPYTSSSTAGSFVVKLRPDTPFLQFSSDVERIFTQLAPGLPDLNNDHHQELSFDPLGPRLEVGNMRDLAIQIPLALRVALTLLGCFSFLGITVAGLGVYAAATLMTATRAHEMGIRVALGASASQIRWLALWRSARLAVIALPMGLFAGWAMARNLLHFLFQVGATDLPTYVASGAFLLAIVLAAGLFPALRIATTDPAAVLRYDC